MPFYEDSLVSKICRAFTCWNGWGPPSSEYLILEFCLAKAESEAEAEEFTDILKGWMTGEYEYKQPLWLDDD